MTSQVVAVVDPGKNQILELLKENRLDEAGALARTLCEQHGENAELWHLRGVACGLLGQVTEAESCFRRAIELRGDLAAMLAFANANKNPRRDDATGVQVTLVAGIGFEPMTFRL